MMRIAAALFAFAATVSHAAEGPGKKAILIGINCYDPAYPACAALKSAPVTNRVKREGSMISGDWGYWKYANLEGARNDVEMMKAVLDLHGFTIPADAVLTDENATADAILSVLRKYLIDDPDLRDGDLRVVYYSGHGNYVRNTAVTDANEYDETIVPSDHWRGVADIRDKELSRIFAEAGRKVKVVFIADSCHSGSLSRGPGARVKTSLSGSADAPDAPRIKDKPSAVDPMRAKYGLVLVSAARRDQPALETEGRSDDANDPFTGKHGAFTWALKRAFDGYGYAPVDVVFQRASALLALDPPNQVPNLEGMERVEINLFGEPATGAAMQTATVQEVSGGAIRLRGGIAVGIYPGTVLKRVAKAGSSVQIEVDANEGLTFSRARVLPNGAQKAVVHKGDLFAVNQWVAPTGAMLNVYLPPALPFAAIQAAAAEFAALKSGLGARWIEDETVAAATSIIRWNGSSWELAPNRVDAKAIDLGAAPRAADVARQLNADTRLLVVLPPPSELVDALPFGSSGKGRIRELKSPANAHYWLRGRITDSAPEYAWIMPAKATLMPLPVRSDWVVTRDAGEAGKKIAELAYRMGRLREWQALSPPAAAKERFPYHLVFRELGTGREFTSGEVIKGHRYKVLLRVNERESKAMQHPVPARYVYIFSIDQHGTGTLVWPVKGRGNQDNVFPRPRAEGEGQAPAPSTIPVSGDEEFDFGVDEPYGTDTYFLLSSVEKVDNPDIFEFDGVRTTARREIRDPLAELLSGLGALTRGEFMRVPAEWDVERAFLRSRAPEIE